jgi:hypothetical protein
MTWFKVDDKLAFHKKVMAAGNAAMGAWVRLGSWSSLQETDGKLPGDIVRTIASEQELAKLLEVGFLLKEGSDGFVLHDFLVYNPSSKELKSNRKRWTEKKRRQRQLSPGDTYDCPPGTTSSVPRGHFTLSPGESPGESPGDSGTGSGSGSLQRGECERGELGESDYDFGKRIWGDEWQKAKGIPFAFQGPLSPEEGRTLRSFGSMIRSRTSSENQDRWARHKVREYFEDTYWAKQNHTLFGLLKRLPYLSDPKVREPIQDPTSCLVELTPEERVLADEARERCFRIVGLSKTKATAKAS